MKFPTCLLPPERTALAAFALLSGLACSAGGGGFGGDAGGSGSSGSSGKGGSSGNGGFGATAGLPDGLPDGSGEQSLLPARVRRLTNAEYVASVRAVFGADVDPGVEFAPDARQAGFTNNDAQRVDPVLAEQFQRAAGNVSTAVVQRIEQFAPCSAGSEECAQTFIAAYGPRIYRRSLRPEETSGLLGVYRAGESGGTYADGIANVVRALLQSAGFLYLTEIGDRAAPTNDVVPLSQDEIAASLAYLITGAPADGELLSAASQGTLLDPAERERQARRLLGEPLAEQQLARVVKEWLGIDRITETGKDPAVYPGFDMLRPSMAAESDAFISEVIFRSSGTLGELFNADWSIVDGQLASFYGLPSGGSGRTSLSAVKRPGLLNRAAFLSVYAHPNESAPVLRGVAFMRRLLCLNMPAPTNLTVVPPPPDPSQTTRQRFSIHNVAECKSCHDPIESFGFAFEHFDGMGRARTEENEQPVDSSTTIDALAELSGSYPSSAELATSLAGTQAVKSCFATHLFRFAAARDEKTAQETFVKIWSELPGAQQDSVIEAMLAYVKSPLFAHRRGMP